MDNKEKYLNLVDVREVFNEDSYEYQTLDNVMASIFDELSDKEAKEIEEQLKN